MRALIQRVTKASVSIAGDTAGEIGGGLVVLLGVCKEDDEDDASFLVERIANLRIFADDGNQLNKSALDVDAELLVVSQFTLYADTRKGNRPSFVAAGPPHEASELIETYREALEQLGVKTASGVFGAMMDVELVNDGPFTILLER